MLTMVAYSHRPQSGHLTCYLDRTYHLLPTHQKSELAGFMRLEYRVARNLLRVYEGGTFYASRRERRADAALVSRSVE
jgi:hypothetical protein